MLMTEQHRAIRDTVVRFVDEQIDPHADDWERAGRFPAAALFRAMGELGLLGIAKPEAYGGLGLDYSYQLVFSEALGRSRSAGVAMAIGVQTDMATPALARHGGDALCREFLAPAIAGDAVFAIAVSEPEAGSDVAAIRTSARAVGDDYLISGSKMWITSATQADYLCLLANTSDDHRHRNKSLIIVPTNLPGISCSEPLDKLGMRASDTAQIFFDEVRVPRRHRIGDEGMGFVYQMQQFQEERLFAAAGQLEPMRRCIEDTIAYARERHTFGRPVLGNQAVQFRLAELRTEVESLRALVYDAGERYVHGEDVTLHASMAKLKAGRLVREVADACLQYWGGMGFIWDNPAARLYRDGRLVSIGGGSDEMMLSIIARQLGMADTQR